MNEGVNCSQFLSEMAVKVSEALRVTGSLPFKFL